MTLKMEEKDGVLVAWLTGELDHHAAEGVRRELTMRSGAGGTARLCWTCRA